jgi:hypothetical protein
LDSVASRFDVGALSRLGPKSTDFAGLARTADYG